MNLPTHTKGIIHPMIKDIYLKSDMYRTDKAQNILVIKTQNNEGSIMSLLGDLKEIQAKAEQQFGHIDHVDLMVH